MEIINDPGLWRWADLFFVCPPMSPLADERGGDAARSALIDTTEAGWIGAGADVWQVPVVHENGDVYGGGHGSEQKFISFGGVAAR